MAFIELRDIVKKYKVGDVEIIANDHISFEIEEGEFVVILGPSGAGKSTVLNILGGMDVCDSGKIMVDGQEVSAFNERQLIDYRRKDVGFVFQFYNLVPNLTAKENVELANQIVEDAKEAAEVLEECGLKERMNNFIAQLSGGEQQRVTIARAIAKNPKLLLCDEPTGALDSETGRKILELLKEISRNTHTTVAIITHNSALAPIADKVIQIHDAKVLSVEKNEQPKEIGEVKW